MRLVLISLARRGGMVHFHAELANSLHKIAPETKVITSRSVPSSLYSSAIPRLVVNTGQGPASSLLNAINPLSWRNLYKLLQGSRADIFHIVASHEWNPILAQLIGILRKPLVFTMYDPETANFDVTAVLTLYKRPERLVEQLDALEKQTVKPREILLFQDAATPPIDFELDEKTRSRITNYIKVLDSCILRNNEQTSGGCQRLLFGE